MSLTFRPNDHTLLIAKHNTFQSKYNRPNYPHPMPFALLMIACYAQHSHVYVVSPISKYGTGESRTD